MKNKKGSITLFVLFSGLFFIMFLSTVLMYSSIKRKTEAELAKSTEEIYSNKDPEEVYQNYFGVGEVPIYTKEQLFKMASGENVQIKEEGGKIYKFASNSVYILKNDLEFEYNGTWDMPTFTDNGKIEGNGKQIKIKDTSKIEEVYYYYNEQSQYKYAITNEGYIYKGLLLNFYGINNTGRGHSTTTSTWKDLSGNGNDATLSTTTSAWGRTATIFSSSNALYLKGNRNVLYAPEEYTMQFSVYTNATQNQCLYCSRTASGKGIAVFMLSNKIRIDTGSYQWSTGIDVATKKITNIAVTRNSSGIKLYINGVLKASTTKTGDKTSINSGLYTIGQSQTSGSGLGNQLSGYLYNINIYDRVLSAEEINFNI